jgi:hypothetical protein
VAKAMLDLLNDIKKAASVGSEFLDDGCDRGVGICAHRSTPRNKS